MTNESEETTDLSEAIDQLMEECDIERSERIREMAKQVADLQD